MKSFILALFLLSSLLVASDNYSLRVAYGEASKNDLGEILLGKLGPHPKDLSVIAVDGGYLYIKNAFDFPIDVYFKGGLSYFNEDTHDNVLEGVAYIKLFYNINVLSNDFRFGFGEGVSYASSVLETEYDESIEKDRGTSNFLNYLDISFDFDVGKLVHSKPLEQLYLGILLKHRSGVFGLYNNVSGGSNYNSVYIEKKF